jgi:hypothetical protein
MDIYLAQAEFYLMRHVESALIKSHQVSLCTYFELSFNATAGKQACQICPDTIYQHGEIYTKLPQNITNVHKIYQMDVKLTKCP